MYLKKCLLFNKKYEFDLQNVAKKYRKLYEKRKDKNSPSKLFFNQEFMKNANDHLVPLSNSKTM